MTSQPVGMETLGEIEAGETAVIVDLHILEQPQAQVVPEIEDNTRAHVESLVKGHELPDGLTQSDAKLFIEMATGLLHSAHPNEKVPSREYDEYLGLYLRGYGNKAIAILSGHVKSPAAIGRMRWDGINRLNAQGYTPDVFSFLLHKFVDADVEHDNDFWLPSLLDGSRRKQEASDDADEDDSEATDKPDRLDIPAPNTDLISVYLAEIGRYPLLIAEQEVKLARQMEDAAPATDLLDALAESGVKLDPEIMDYIRAEAVPGIRSKNAMIESNLRLAVSFAKRYQGKGLGLLELIQEANLGVIRAVEKFDYTKGNKFSTYATWWIRQSMQRAIADKATAIRIPVHIHENINKMLRVKRELTDEVGQEPTNAEIAMALGSEESKIEDWIEFDRISNTTSLNNLVGEDGDAERGDFVADVSVQTPDDAAEQTMLAADIGTVLSKLPERNAKIMEMRFGLDNGTPKTLEEIGAELNLTREAVRLIEVKTLHRLRANPQTREKLVDYY